MKTPHSGYRQVGYLEQCFYIIRGLLRYLWLDILNFVKRRKTS